MKRDLNLAKDVILVEKTFGQNWTLKRHVEKMHGFLSKILNSYVLSPSIYLKIPWNTSIYKHYLLTFIDTFLWDLDLV